MSGAASERPAASAPSGTNPPHGSLGVYLDWNATTPLADEARAAMDVARETAWANPASVHTAGRRARKILEETREQLGALLSLEPRDVLFTSGGTEANNLALAGAAGLALSRIEHPSLVRVAERLAALGRPVVWLPVRPDGQLEPAQVRELCQGLPPGSWLAAMLVNHETGVIQPLEQLAEAARGLGLKVHSDAVQAVGKIDLTPLLSADSVSLAAHKLRGPKGIGALCLRARGSVLPAPPTPVLVGGSQERGLRPGTQDAVAAAGFGAALSRLPKLKAGLEQASALRDRLEAAVGHWATVNGATVNGSAPRAPHVSNLHFRGWRGDELVAALDLEQIYVSAGSACSAGTLEPSPVLLAMLGVEAATESVRFSFGEDATDSDLSRVLAVLERLERLRGPGT